MEYIATDPVSILQANCAMRSMGTVKGISALLLDGPPGAGKSYLAAYLAHVLQAKMMRFQVFPGCGSEDLILDRSFGGDGHGVLLQAIESSKKEMTLLLLDEIDKADVRVDSFLLNFLQDGEIFVPQLGVFEVNSSNLLVVITKNDVREVAAPLLRRCRVTYMSWPSMDVEKRIIRTKLPFLDDNALEALLEVPHYLRGRPDVIKPPSTPEMVRLASDLLTIFATTPGIDKLNVGRYYVNSIAQTRADQAIVENHKSPIFLGTRITETFQRFASQFDLPPGVINLPVPKAIIHERR